MNYLCRIHASVASVASVASIRELISHIFCVKSARQKGFTLVELSVSIGLISIIAGFMLISFGWIRHNLSVLQKAGLHSTMKYVHNIMNNELLLASEIIVPPSAGANQHYNSHILYRNEKNELVVIFCDHHGYLVMYNHSLDQFRDLMPFVKNFRAWRSDQKFLEYEFNLQQGEYGYSYQNALRLMNVLP